MLLAFLEKLLQYNPKGRPKPLEALLNPYFNEMRTENFKWNFGNGKSI